MATPKSGYLREIYIGGAQGGLVPQTTNYELLREQARQKLPDGAYKYVAGSASSEKTLRNNAKALDAWQIVPRMLAGVELEEFSQGTTMFGRKFPTAFVISPIGVQAQLHPEADCGTAKAASELGIPFTLSSATSRSMEKVMEEGGFSEGESEAWFQLYWPSDIDITKSLLQRAKKAGYKVLVVTLDTWSLGWRPQDLDTAYNPFLKGEGVANLFSDPVFIEKYCDGKSPTSSSASEEDRFSASATCISLLTPGRSRSWEDLAELREIWGDDPIVLKGIQCVSDTARAIQSGMDGVWVSNHGGRQVDGAIGSLQALGPIADYISTVKNQKGDKPTVIFDSGVRTGADAMKAIALGADAIGIGRPYAWGLAVGGVDGVTAILKTIMADFELNAALAGCKSIADIGRHTIIKAGGECHL